MRVSIGLADDQQLFLKSLSALINTFSGFEVTIEAINGKDLIGKLCGATVQPELILIDVSMPVMNGAETVRHLTAHFPAIRTIALSMNDDDTSILSMLRAGCCAYLVKDIHPAGLEQALTEVLTKGYYNADSVTPRHHRIMAGAKGHPELPKERELQFLQLVCSDLTYSQIADKMSLAERTIDGYREILFEKLQVKSRVGLALEAIRRNLVALPDVTSRL